MYTYRIVFEQYKKSGTAKAGHEGKLEVPYSFYEDLVKHNLYDNYKEKYAIENGYKFIIIPYWYEKNDYYKEILDNELNNNKT